MQGQVVTILDGNSEIGAHVWSDLGCLICLNNLFRLKVVTNLIFFRKYLFFLIPAQQVLSNHLILLPWQGRSGGEVPPLEPAHDHQQGCQARRLQLQTIHGQVSSWQSYIDHGALYLLQYRRNLRRGHLFFSVI